MNAGRVDAFIAVAARALGVSAPLLLLACGPAVAGDAPGLGPLSRQLADEVTRRATSPAAVSGARRCRLAWYGKYRSARRVARQLAVTDWWLAPAAGHGTTRYERVYRGVVDNLRERLRRQGVELPSWVASDAWPAGSASSEIPTLTYPGSAGATKRRPVVPPPLLRRHRDESARHLAAALGELVDQCAAQPGVRLLPALQLLELFRLVSPLAASHEAANAFSATHRLLCGLPPRGGEFRRVFSLLARQAGAVLAPTAAARARPVAACPAVTARISAGLAHSVEGVAPASEIRRLTLLWQTSFLVRGIASAQDVVAEIVRNGHRADMLPAPDTPRLNYSYRDLAFLLVSSQFLSLAGSDQRAGFIVERLLLWERAVKNNGLRLRDPASRQGGKSRLTVFPHWLALAYSYATLASLLDQQQGQLTSEQLGNTRLFSRDGFSAGLGEVGFWYAADLAVAQ